MVAFVVILLMLGLFCPTVESLKCYRCTGVGPETDCELSIKELPEYIQICRPLQKYCTIRRVEKTKYPGKVWSFSRSCETDPVIKNDVDVGAEVTTFFVSCQTDLCNSGDGTPRLPSKRMHQN